MALFSGLSEKLNHIFSKLTKHGRLTELEIKTAMREVRIALLEADVNISVVKSFVARVSERAVGQEILKSLSPTQQVIKIVNEELIELMGSANSKLAVSSTPPTVIMMAGLQGAGKTTLVGKLGMLLKKQGKKPATSAAANSEAGSNDAGNANSNANSNGNANGNTSANGNANADTPAEELKYYLRAGEEEAQNRIIETYEPSVVKTILFITLIFMITVCLILVSPEMLELLNSWLG